MNVRQARIEDSAALAQVQVDSYRTAYAGMLPQAYLDRFAFELPQRWFWVIMPVTSRRPR